MTTSLLRPEISVIARTSSRDVAEQMRSCGTPEVLNPLDRFGDHLRILLRSPSAYRLMMWLTSAPGTPIPPRRAPLPHGRWVVCGYGRFGRELTADLRAEGLDVAVVEGEEGAVGGKRIDVDEVTRAVEQAVAFVAATESDITNLWLVEMARKANPDAFMVAMQNRAANAALFSSVGIDFGMMPGELLAHEALARLANPVLMRFLPEVPRQGEEWAARMVERLVARCGPGTPDLWLLRLTREEAPAVAPWLADGLRVGDLMRHPTAREEPVAAVVLALLRDDTRVLAPDDDYELRLGDQLLLAGRASAQHSLGTTLEHEPTAAYVVEGRLVPSSWLWRRFSRKGAGRPHQPV